MEFTGFIGPSYTLSSVNADCQRSVNLYPEVDELGTEKNHEIARLVSRPGLKPLSILAPATGVIRGMYTASNGRVFYVRGSVLVEITSTGLVERGTFTTLGGSHIDPVTGLVGVGTFYFDSPNSGTARIEMTDNGLQLLTSNGYTLNFADNTFAVIPTTQSFPLCTDVCFIDQYCIANSVGTRQFFISNLSDATLWDGADVGEKEGGPDILITLVADHRELILFGDLTTEFWYDSGAADFPFTRRPDVFIERGIIGPGAKAKMDSGVFFWAKDKTGSVMAMRITGANPQRVSTHAIEAKVATYGDIRGAVCWSYQWNGHSFWVTTFPSADVTWVYDAATGLWHECQSGEGPWKAQYHCFDGKTHYVGSSQDYKVFALDDKTYDDDGAYMARIRRAPHISEQLKRLIHSCFQLDMETGTIADGLDPKITLRISDDGGHSWGHEKLRSAGKTGQYRKRIRWYRLGQSRDRVYEVKVTDPIPVTMLSAQINPED